MAEPLDAIKAIHNAFRADMTRIWQMVMPSPVFDQAKLLIQKAIGSEWAELVRRIPVLA